MLSRPPTVLSALLALLWVSQCVAILVNITVDDTNTTAWTWAGSWNAITQKNPCTVCFAQPDGSRTHNYSWHDGNLLSGSFTFQGVAVYIYGIDVVDPANITFAMSNPPISAFHYKDSGGGFIYDSLFFSADGLDGTTQHTVTWNEKSNSISGGGAGLFDYAVVTVDKSATSSQPSTSASGSTSSSSFPSAINSESGGLTSNTRKSNAGIFAGGVIGSLALLSLLAAVVYYCLRRRSRSASSLLMRITSRSSVLHPDHFVEPFQVPQSSRTTYTSSLPARASTIPPIFVSTVTPQNPKGLSSWGTPSPSSLAHARDAEVEQRLRNLEAMVAERGPPAYV